jgi:hypothetical protein
MADRPLFAKIIRCPKSIGRPAFGQALSDALNGGDSEGQLDLGCVSRAPVLRPQSEDRHLRDFCWRKTRNSLPVQVDLAAPIQRHGTDD